MSTCVQHIARWKVIHAQCQFTLVYVYDDDEIGEADQLLRACCAATSSSPLSCPK